VQLGLTRDPMQRAPCGVEGALRRDGGKDRTRFINPTVPQCELGGIRSGRISTLHAPSMKVPVPANAVLAPSRFALGSARLKIN
jgi:hypothetical protein